MNTANLKKQILNLLDCQIRREPKEALVFYLAHIFIMLIFVFVVAFCAELSGRLGDSPNKVLENQRYLGLFSAALYTTGLSSYVVIRKKLFSWRGINLILLSSFFSIIFSGLAGLLIPAYLTTYEPG